MRAIVGVKKERPADVREILRRRTVICAGPNVRDHYGAGGRPIGFPQLAAVRPIERSKERRSIDVGKGAGARAVYTRANFFDHDGSGRCAVALPELIAMRAIVGAEE